jgi:hypothetical protein
MSETIIKENIVGARNVNSVVNMIILVVAGTGFFLAGLSRYLNVNLLQ